MRPPLFNLAALFKIYEGKKAMGKFNSDKELHTV